MACGQLSQDAPFSGQSIVLRRLIGLRRLKLSREVFRTQYRAQGGRGEKTRTHAFDERALE
jgi:hypothetical protein